MQVFYRDYTVSHHTHTYTEHIHLQNWDLLQKCVCSSFPSDPRKTAAVCLFWYARAHLCALTHKHTVDTWETGIICSTQWYTEYPPLPVSSQDSLPLSLLPDFTVNKLKRLLRLFALFFQRSQTAPFVFFINLAHSHLSRQILLRNALIISLFNSSPCQFHFESTLFGHLRPTLCSPEVKQISYIDWMFLKRVEKSQDYPSF